MKINKYLKPPPRKYICRLMWFFASTFEAPLFFFAEEKIRIFYLNPLIGPPQTKIDRWVIWFLPKKKKLSFATTLLISTKIPMIEMVQYLTEKTPPIPKKRGEAFRVSPFLFPLFVWETKKRHPVFPRQKPRGIFCSKKSDFSVPRNNKSIPRRRPRLTWVRSGPTQPIPLA